MNIRVFRTWNRLRELRFPNKSVIKQPDGISQVRNSLNQEISRKQLMILTVKNYGEYETTENQTGRFYLTNSVIDYGESYQRS